MSDKLLLFQLKIKRDPETFSRFYDSYVDRIYRFIYFKVSQKEDVEDITAEVFLKFWQYLRENIEVKNLNALVYTIARHLVIDYYRKKSRQEILFDEEYVLVSIARFDSLSVEMPFVNSDDMSRLTPLLFRLKEEYREVIVLRFVEEYSLKEIGVIMDKSTGSVKVLLYRALKRLRFEYEKKFGKDF